MLNGPRDGLANAFASGHADGEVARETAAHRAFLEDGLPRRALLEPAEPGNSWRSACSAGSAFDVGVLIGPGSVAGSVRLAARTRRTRPSRRRRRWRRR